VSAAGKRARRPATRDFKDAVSSVPPSPRRNWTEHKITSIMNTGRLVCFIISLLREAPA
jgi:hypothetical protein